MIAAARAVTPSLPVLYHSDGKLTGLLPDLIDAGVTAINPVQPECMPTRETKREFGRDLVLWGCCPVQSVYAFGTRGDVEAHVSLLRELGAEGGLVTQFYNMILTPTVRENLRTFFEVFAAAWPLSPAPPASASQSGRRGLPQGAEGCARRAASR